MFGRMGLYISGWGCLFMDGALYFRMGPQICKMGGYVCSMKVRIQDPGLHMRDEGLYSEWGDYICRMKGYSQDGGLYSGLLATCLHPYSKQGVHVLLFIGMRGHNDQTRCP